MKHPGPSLRFNQHLRPMEKGMNLAIARQQDAAAVCVACGKWPAVSVEVDGIPAAVCAGGGCLADAWAIVHGRERDRVPA